MEKSGLLTVEKSLRSETISAWPLSITCDCFSGKRGKPDGTMVGFSK